MITVKSPAFARLPPPPPPQRLNIDRCITSEYERLMFQNNLLQLETMTAGRCLSGSKLPLVPFVTNFPLFHIHTLPFNVKMQISLFLLVLLLGYIFMGDV